MGNSNDKTYSIEKSSQIMIVSMLQNWSSMYYSHHIIVKFISFKPIYCVINLDIASSSIVFSDFDYLFLSEYY